MRRRLTREQALLMVNQHAGEEVLAAVEIDIGDWVTGVVHVEGRLTELRPLVGREPAKPTEEGDEPTGIYAIGDSTIYVPDQGYKTIAESVAGPGIHVTLADNVGLRINWGQPGKRRPALPQDRE